MMLYKYIPLARGSEIIRRNQVCFSLSENFNDPFDKPRYPRDRSLTLMEELLDPLQRVGKELAWATMTGILSLTRTPANPLMWAHYASGHTGMVIGFDAVAAGFTDEATNLIPAQFGSVVYVSRRPTTPFLTKHITPLNVGNSHHFVLEHYEKLQRIFLHKSIHWSYEEEVRVVKSLSNQSDRGGVTLSGSFDTISANDTRYHMYHLPAGAIKDIYFGLHSDHEKSDEIYYHAKERYPQIRAHDCVLDDSALAVDFADYTTMAEAASP
ncbi:MAG: hypothetical protein BGN82_00940 [Alphaproteobacteria bacterium 65-7]|nr:MAG: hypothetical protein BGN82_00940 [Alphaproteobacteria bacterium 65-7]